MLFTGNFSRNDQQVESDQTFEELMIQASEVPEDDIEVEEEEKDVVVVVDVKGAVEHPGVYEIQAGSRVQDVIQIAGGFLKDADSTQINLAKTVQDEDVIYVMKKGEVLEKNPFVNSTVSDGKIDINHASLPDLQQIPGIGPSKAKAIEEYRTKNGGFKSVDDLLNVTGIGAQTLAKIKDQIVVR